MTLRRALLAAVATTAALASTLAPAGPAAAGQKWFTHGPHATLERCDFFRTSMANEMQLDTQPCWSSGPDWYFYFANDY